MVVEAIIVCLLAKMRRYKLRYLFRTWTFYPILLMQCGLVVLQASLFFRQYIFVPFVPYTEMAVILSFIFALLAFRLYTPAIVGSASIGVGTLLNKLVIAQNAGKMPVYPSLSYLTGYVTPEMVASMDNLHSVGGPEAKLAFLADYIDYGYCILSPGDVFIHLFACIIFYALIKAVNARYGDQSR
ncbi:MAG: DUF5317 domain-containing protein [Clostridiales bacterium]|nr:DUF5317 domain-containing protein [Clostridiales bacterium]